mgnify:FL=1
MIKAGIKKEFMLFSRGFRLIGVIITIIGISLMYPLMYKSMEMMAGQIADMGQQIGGEAQDQVTGAVDSINGMMSSLEAMYGGSMAAVGFKTGVSSITSTGFLIISLLLMATAGGEQKKRSVIIPNCAGLTPAGYVLPKFIVYPLVIGVLSFLGGIITGCISNLMYNNELSINDIMFSSLCAAIYMLFMIALYFLIGLSTGRPGISVIIVYGGSTIIPILLQSLDIDRYNPFTLQSLLMSSYNDADMNNFMLSTVVAFILSVICCLLALMIMTLRRVDNTVGEANL